MEYKKLGRTGLWVSKLCLGTMNFGAGTDEKDAYRIMDAALDAGINFFDTANNYGFLVGKVGITEEIIGRWFKQAVDAVKKQFWQQKFMRTCLTLMMDRTPSQDFPLIKSAVIGKFI